jgi:hypothetical protein
MTARRTAALHLMTAFLILTLFGIPAQAAPDNYSSRLLPAKRASVPPVIDGKLDDAVWKEAPVAQTFIDTVTEKPTQEQTEVRMLYDDKALYLAYYCHDSRPDKIVAREIRYGAGTGNDDFVSFTIDPYYTKGYATFSNFTVTPLGTQNENIAGGRAAKREWRGVWQAAAQRVSDGWTVEMRIPWAMLNFPDAKSAVTMGINFSRYHARSQINSAWSNLTRSYRSEYIGQWQGVVPPRGVHIQNFQELVYVSPEWSEGGHPEIHAGADLRYRPNPQMTGVLSISPDFRNVERAVEGIQFSRSERYVGETRPFFVEGRRFFPGLLYSPRIENFDVGVKAFGKVNSNLSFGLLSVERSLNYNATAAKVDYSLAQHGDISIYGTLRRSGDPGHDGYGAAASLASGNWGVDMNFVRAREGSAGGGSMGTSLGYFVPHWNAQLGVSLTDPQYSPSLGFVSFTDERDISFGTGYNATYRTGPLRDVNVGFNLFRMVHMNGAFFQEDASLYTSVTTRSDYALSFGRDVGRFENAHDRTFNLSLAGNTSDRYRNWNLSYQWGLLDDHNVGSLNLGATRRLFHKMDVSVSGSILRHKENREQYIVTAGWELDARRAINGRLVQEDGHLNWYAAFRNAGGVGQDIFVIVGDPNAKRFTTRVALKWVWAN